MDNWRMARICESIANTILKTIPIPRGRPHPRPFKVADFLPVFKGNGNDLTPQQQEHIRKKHGKRRHSHN